MKKTITFFKTMLLAVILLVGSGSVYGATYTLVTTAPSDWSGNYLIVSGTSALSGGTSSWGTFEEVTVSGNDITTASNISVTISAGATSGTYYIYQNSNSTYLKEVTSNTFATNATATTDTEWVISLNNGNIQIGCASATTRLLRLNGTSGFRCYTTATGTLPKLYKLEATCTTPTTSFASASVSKLTTDAAFTNAFTSNNTSTKVWSSTNEAVATVDSNGEVTIVGAGSTNIRVNQAADATYCAVVDASYALTVTAPGVAEPTNQPTSFTASTNSTSQITVNWTDATGAQLPEHYLVKASTGAVTAPIDGTAEADAALVKNIAQGTQTAVFTGLNASTTYHFSIWPYTNSGAAIDYKTDGTIATASATTETPLGVPVATAATDISATGFTANWGVAASATGYDVNVYTKSIGTASTATEILNNPGSDQNAPLGWTYNNISSASYIKMIMSTSSVVSPTIDLTNYATAKLNANLGSFGTISSSSNKFTISVSTNNGANWTVIATPLGTNASSGTYSNGYAMTELDLDDYVGNSQVKIKFETLNATGSTGGRLSKIVLTGKLITTTSTPISGSPFTVTETSKAVSGLNPGTEYFYTIVAKNASGSSAVSNEISVTTPKITFTGTGEWTETARWNTGAVPGATAQVVVDGAATINSDVEVAGLTINSGKSLTVNPAKQLTISGAATNNGTIIIQSDENGTGTVVGNVSGAATVNQYLKGDYRTWYLSSPVANAQPANMGWIKYYNEADGSWPTLFDARTSTAVAYGSNSFVTAKGYLVVPSTSAVANANIQFAGELNTGDKSIALTNSVTNTSKPGFNLVGNPYPSYLKWADVYAANSSKLSSTSIWYRTKQLNEYVFWTVNGDGVVTPLGVSASSNIPPMQAFWVKATAGGGTLELTNNMRSHANATGFLLKAPAVDTRTLIRLQVSNGTNTDEAVLYLSDNANNGLDAFDAPKMTNDNASIAEIFTRAGSEKLVINAMRTLPRDTEIALGFEAGSATSFTLRVNELSNLPSDVQLILKDNVTKAETDLTDGTAVYSFSNIATSGDRFSIIFRTAGAVTGIDQPDFSGLSAYSNANNQLTVLYDGVIDAHTVVSVYNAVGQRLVTQSLKGASTVIDGTFTPGVYVVKVNNLSRKLTINN